MEQYVSSVELLLNVSIFVGLPRTQLMNTQVYSFGKPNSNGAITGTYSFKTFILKCYKHIFLAISLVQSGGEFNKRLPSKGKRG